jgi:hypothetical protein
MYKSMLYKFGNGRALTDGLEYSVSYHCNLRCAGCSHLSPFQPKKFPSLKSFRSDIIKLGEVLHTSEIRLLGGEPLLNPQIDEYIKEAKKSGIADIVAVTTNGLFLHNMSDDFWNNIDIVRISAYPGYELKDERIKIIKEHAEETNTVLELDLKSSFRTTITTKPHPKDWVTGMIFRTCKNVHLWHCHMIHEGKLYKCAVPPFLPPYLSKLEIYDYDPAIDAFDIHNSSDIYKDLKRFLTSQETINACRYCLGYVGKIQRHHQLDGMHIHRPKFQNISRSTHLDFRLLLKESLDYYRRRCYQQLLGKQQW